MKPMKKKGAKGGMMKKKGYAKGGATMKKKGAAKGGMMKKKGYAKGGYAKGGAPAMGLPQIRAAAKAKGYKLVKV